jgi:hypothetical protein
MTAPKTQIIRYLPVNDIFILDRHRQLDEGAVTSLMESIREIDLLTPISVRLAQVPDSETGELEQEFVLITGHHRLEAFKRLGRDEIPVIVRECSDIDAELEEIDENLARAELSNDEKRIHLRRRKELWEQRKLQEAEESGTPCPTFTGRGNTAFATETAARTGLSKRHINRLLADPKPRPQIKDEGDPDMQNLAVAHANKLASKYTVGQLQEYLDHFSEATAAIIKNRMG